MEFIIEDRVFDMLPNVCFGVVVARGVNNRGINEEILKLLEESIELARKKFEGVNIKAHPDILCYREALRKLNINPNKFPCSVESMTSRVVKGNNLPSINNVVNLINAVSLKHTLPMGAHDLKCVEGNLKVCFSKGGEPFIPFGESKPEYVEEGELVYADDRTVKTRRWIWRQSEIGKITEESTDIFIPIDGFIDYNKDAVLRARDELAEYFREFFNVEPEVFFLHAGNLSVKIM